MQVEEVFLQFIRLVERLGARGAAVLDARRRQVASHVTLPLLALVQWKSYRAVLALVVSLRWFGYPLYQSVQLLFDLFELI